ncbi:MAG: tetratricopeptide repeat protein [Acidobacteria bacterium]|nr:tetratricopeptide repeat protein [Acidobacteriota bacterium]
MKRLAWVFSLAVSGLLAAAPELEQAQRRYNHTDYEGALKLLLPLGVKDGAVFELIGKCHFMTGEFKQATEAFEMALAAEPTNSGFAHWLGKAYGKRAETSSPFTAPGYAGKARRYFEQAVQLDPANSEAVNDLFEYYMQAPGFLGGGLDKAAALAKRIAAQDPVEGDYALARIAEKRKEYGTAEEHLRRAVEGAPMQVGRVVDLARFLAKQGKIHESEQTFLEAERISPNDPKVLFARAETYIKARRNLEQARDLLKRYLAAPPTPDNPSRSAAEKLLREAGG